MEQKATEIPGNLTAMQETMNIHLIFKHIRNMHICHTIYQHTIDRFGIECWQ